MKQIYSLSFLIFLISFSTYSQQKKTKYNGIFYKVGLATTLSTNEDYNASEDILGGNTGAPSIFINNGLGYQFKRLTLISLNLEYNRYSQPQYNFAPLYISFQRNIIRNKNDFYLRGGYGKLLNISKRFQKGNLFKLGAGTQIHYNNGNNSVLIGVDYTKKALEDNILKSLSSFAIYLEFMLF